MIYVATDFGWTRNRPDSATTFGSGHDLNNGFVLCPDGQVTPSWAVSIR